MEQLEDTSTHLIKGEDEDQEMNEEEEEKEEIELGDPEEEVLMTIVPKANINGLKYSGGIRTRPSYFTSDLYLPRKCLLSTWQ